MDWSAAQYKIFEPQRSLAVRDLLAKLPGSTTPVYAVADLGCGPGNSTQLLSLRFPEAIVTAVDNSPDMVEAARGRLPGVQFELGDIAQWNPADASYNVILSNASLQWVPDHATVLPRWISKLVPGGSLAVQIPDNLGEPAHELMRETARCGPWAKRLAAVGQTHEYRYSPEWYYSKLSPLAEMNVWRTTYYHCLPGGARAIVEWFRGSALKSFLAPLTQDEREEFLKHYEALIARAYPAFSDGPVLLPFPRLFFIATRNM